MADVIPIKAPVPNPAPIPGSKPIKCLIYGDVGSHKSHMLSTFPKPLLVSQFDPWGKEAWFERLGDKSPLRQTAEGLPFIEMTHNGALVARVEFFLDMNPEKPTALALFRKRYAELFDSGEIRQYATYGIDSVTWMDQAAFNESKYLVNRAVQTGGDQRGGPHFFYSRLQLQSLLQGRIAGYPPLVNMVVIAHVEKEPDEEHGTTIRNPAAPGQLSKRLPTGFAELYRAYIASDGRGGSIPLLQTCGDFRFNAGSQIPAPNPCAPDYAALWAAVRKP